MKKSIAFVLAMVILLAWFAGCGKTTGNIAGQDEEKAENSGMRLHKIGVATYNIKDAQVMMFKDYLDNYIKECFTDVTFLYSDTITSEEEMMDFLAQCAESGVEGIMAFNSYDLKKEVEFCADHKMYLIRPAGTFSDEEFHSVSDNPYFLGQIGPGIQNEYEEGAKMARALAGEDKCYVILSGGACMGNEMHRQRTMAMLDVLQEIHHVKLNQSSEELAVTEKPVRVEKDGLKIAVYPGYMDFEDFQKPASEAISSGEYTTVLASIPVTDLKDAMEAVDIECGTIDCFSEDNYFGFKKGKIAYVAGKYQSEIGPGFAALFNAITGNADAFRVDGKAFRLEQGFWVARDESEYDSMYALASSATINAYNYEDLYSVIKSLHSEADFESFKKLVESYSYEECLARRTF